MGDYVVLKIIILKNIQLIEVAVAFLFGVILLFGANQLCNQNPPQNKCAFCIYLSRSLQDHMRFRYLPPSIWQ